MQDPFRGRGDTCISAEGPFWERGRESQLIGPVSSIEKCGRRMVPFAFSNTASCNVSGVRW